MYCFYCELCKEYKEEFNCEILDIFDTINGRMFLFKCPDCDLTQTSFLELDIEEDSDALAKT